MSRRMEQVRQDKNKRKERRGEMGNYEKIEGAKNE